MEFILVGVAILVNIIFIKWKFDKGKKADAFLDASLLIAVAVLFNGSYGALVAGTIGSAFISLYLYISPLKLGGNK